MTGQNFIKISCPWETGLQGGCPRKCKHLEPTPIHHEARCGSEGMLDNSTAGCESRVTVFMTVLQVHIFVLCTKPEDINITFCARQKGTLTVCGHKERSSSPPWGSAGIEHAYT